MDERWVKAADASPKAHRDLTSVRRLLDGAMGPAPELREASINALCRVVKALEDEDVPASRRAIQEALPRLVGGLLVEEGNVDGCTISILRRVSPDQATVARLMDLLPGARAPDLVLEALRLHPWEEWPGEIERVFAAHLSIAPNAAGYALYCGARHIRLESTLHALREAAGEDRDWQGRHYGIVALGVLLGREELAELALSLLHNLLDSASERSRKDLASVLGWATRGGESLLVRLASDPSAEVREAAVASQQRRAASGTSSVG